MCRYFLLLIKTINNIHGYIIIICLAGLVHLSNGETRVLNKCVNEHIQLECTHQKHCVIDILSAYYGHPPRNHLAVNCTFTMGHCITNASDIWRRCHGRDSCSSLVRQARDEVRNACNTPSQYVTVTYQCRCSGKCSRLPEIENGQISYSSSVLEYGVAATYSCDDGLVLSGPTVRSCNRDGRWTEVQPACSIPRQRCPVANHSIVSSYEDKCLVHYEHSVNWAEANAKCVLSNSTMLTTSNKDRLLYVIWWMNVLNLYGYVWLAREATDDSSTVIFTKNNCLELFRNQSFYDSGIWEQRTTNCLLKDNFICISDPIASTNDSKINKDVALGVGLGLGLALLAVLIVIIIITLYMKKPWSKSSKGECIDLETTQSNSSANLVAQEYMYSNTMDPGIPVDTVSTITGPSTSQMNGNHTNGVAANHEGVTYDDVYVPRNLSTNQNGSNKVVVNNNNKPPIKKKPKISLSKFRVYTAGQNDYENVKLHNITSSLKRKFLPKRRSSPGASEKVETSESSFTELNGTCKCKKCPLPPQRTVSKERQYKNGKCIACGKKPEIVVDTNSGKAILECRGSGGIGIVENDLYHEDRHCEYY